MTSSIVLTRPVSAKKPPSSGSSISGLQTSIINGQTFLTLTDSTRNKTLSVSENVLLFSRNHLGFNEWLRVGNTTDAASGFVAEIDGTICFASAHCENAKGASKDIHIYINDSDMGSIGTLTSSGEAKFVNTSLNLDYQQGDVIRLRAVGNDKIEDTIVKVTTKHRAP